MKRNTPRTDRDHLIREFYEQYNPPESYEDILAICKNPFYSLKRTISAGNLFEVRLMSLGKFVIHGGVILWSLQYNQTQYEKGFMRDKDYRKFIDNFNALYTRHPEKFKKYLKKLEQWIYS